MSTTEYCIKELDKLMTDFRAQGIDTTFIIAALGEICVKAARSEPEYEQTHLDALAAVLQASAQAKRAGSVFQMARAIFDTP
jgi:hypothetical protein